MMTTRHRLVDEYLERLEAAAQRLSVSRRIELLNDMREHIAVTLAERDTPGEAELRELLDRFGDPEEIVTAWLGDDEPSPARPDAAGSSATRGSGVPPMELTTVLFLLLGGFAVGLGWIVGVILLWASTVWTLRDKLIGTFVVPGGLALPVVLYVGGPLTATCSAGPAPPGDPSLATRTCSALVPAWISGSGILILAIAALVTGIYLLRRARARFA